MDFDTIVVGGLFGYLAVHSACKAASSALGLRSKVEALEATLRDEREKAQDLKDRLRRVTSERDAFEDRLDEEAEAEAEESYDIADRLSESYSEGFRAGRASAAADVRGFVLDLESSLALSDR